MRAELQLGQVPIAVLLERLRRSGVRFNAYGEALLPQIPRAPTQPLTVGVRTVAELGFPAGATLTEVISGTPGVRPCPLEAALHLRLAWREAYVSPRITVLSRRARPEETEPRGFYLRDDADGCWLRAFVASEDWVMAPAERLAVGLEEGV